MALEQLPKIVAAWHLLKKINTLYNSPKKHFPMEKIF